MNTPAVTMVAAWISAETGVGPSIASGSQVCRKSCADLPIAPMNSSTHSRSSYRRDSPGNGWSCRPCRAIGGEDFGNRSCRTPEGAEDAEHEAEVADAVDDEGLDRGGAGDSLAVPEADQQIGGEATPSQPKNICTRLSPSPASAWRR
jgi:hypothetical protein